MNNNKFEYPKVTIHTILPLINTILSGLVVGVVANKLYSGEEWSSVFGRLGWWHILVFAWFGVLIAEIFRARGTKTAVEKLISVFRTHERKTAQQIIQHLLEILGTSIIYPLKSAPLNIHLFLTDKIDGKIALIKDRSVAYEQDPMPHNNPLDYVFVEEDELVICESFRRDKIVYEELPSNHMERYNNRLRDKVDPSIAWVLACPLHVPNSQPLGVICCFGQRLFFKDENKRKYFEILLIRVAALITLCLRRKDGLDVS